MKTLIGIVVGIAIAVAGYFFFVREETPDMSEQEQEVPAEEQAAEERDVEVVGTWQSTQDANFTRTFTADGEVRDAYAGDAEASATGTWKILTGAELAVITLPVSAEAYGETMQVTFDDEVFYFGISADSDADTLNLVNLSGNGVLSFSRVAG